VTYDRLVKSRFLLEVKRKGPNPRASRQGLGRIPSGRQGRNMGKEKVLSDLRKGKARLKTRALRSGRRDLRKS